MDDESTIFEEVALVLATQAMANERIAYVNTIKCTSAERTDRLGSYKITFNEAH